MKKHHFLPAILIGLALVQGWLPVPSPTDSPSPLAASLAQGWGMLPLYFIANRDQIDPRVVFYVQGRDKTLYFTEEGVTFALDYPGSPPPEREEKGSEVSGRWIVKLNYVDANRVRPVGKTQTEAVISYFRGSRSEWRTGLPTYSQIVYRNLWEGIDLVYSGTVNHLKYEFIVQPGADPDRIRLAYHGALVRLNQAGQLEVSTPVGAFQDDAPIAYQEVDGQRVPVSVSYALEDTPREGVGELDYGFRVGSYDPALPLVIDPEMLVYCGYLGGNGEDSGKSIAVDPAGNAYITGTTASIESTFPVTVGPDLNYNGGSKDVFVAKLNASGTALIYAGYIGGDAWDRGDGIAVDAAGNAYVTGVTESNEATFPVRIGPFLNHNGKRDAFVAKVNVNGTDLVYAGFIGGSDVDFGMGIAVDGAGNAYVTGYTASNETTFPVTVGPDLDYNGGSRDAFVAKVNASGTSLVYAGYIGGSDSEISNGIAVDAAGNAYLTGHTASTEATFPVTSGPNINYSGGPADAFVAKVNVNGTALVYCGYLGGDGGESGDSIAVDSAGYAYLTGVTTSTEASFPVTVGPDTTYNGGSSDAFVAKVNVSGTALIYAGFIGGSEWDFGEGVAVDALGNASIMGNTNSTEPSFPVMVGPDLTHNGNTDAFVARVKADGTGLVFSGFIGGSAKDEGYGIAVDAVGNTYVTGSTASTETTFPEYHGPDLDYNGGISDAFVAKISIGASIRRIYLPLLLK